MNRDFIFFLLLEIRNIKMKQLILLNFLFALSINFTDAQQISLISYNIYHGESPTQPGNPTLDSIAEYLIRLQPDAIALQEVDSMTHRSANSYGEKIDLISKLAIKTGYKGYFGRSMGFDGGAYGNGILNKKSKGYHTLALPNPANGEPRAVVWSQLELKSLEEIYIGNTHLDHEFEENRIAQIDSLISYADSLPLPAFIVGDFNFEEGSEAYRRIPAHWKDAGKEAGNDEPTYPGTDGKRIDYLFYDSTYFQLVSYEVIQLPYSDHYAIWVTLDLIKRRKDSEN
jgi:endonuclease/exonuclease/phosphatase family metal-dependent hydrolase